ncbi:MAG: 2-keto-4-pentenoate hydratase [Hyphomicrobiales bacterium]
MNGAQIETAARHLWTHWREGTRTGGLPDGCRPATRAGAYRIAETLAGLSQQKVVGWKIAATSAAGQKHINVDGPLAGRLLQNRVLAAGATVRLGDNIMRVAEAEFAFSFGEDLPAELALYDRSEVLAAVAGLHLSLEIPDSRYRDYTAVGAAQLIADTACASWLVTAPSAYAEWRSLDLVRHRVAAHVNGSLVASGSGEAVLGDPVIALTWLVNEVATYSGGIKAGDLVTTGTCLKPVTIAPGDEVRLDYGMLGTLSARID